MDGDLECRRSTVHLTLPRLITFGLRYSKRILRGPQTKRNQARCRRYPGKEDTVGAKLMARTRTWSFWMRSADIGPLVQ